MVHILDNDFQEGHKYLTLSELMARKVKYTAVKWIWKKESKRNIQEMLQSKIISVFDIQVILIKVLHISSCIYLLGQSLNHYHYSTFKSIKKLKSVDDDYGGGLPIL